LFFVFFSDSFVNHTLANLNPDDPNPVAMKHASPIQQGQLPGLTREESLEWAKNVEREMRGEVTPDVEVGGTKSDMKE